MQITHYHVWIWMPWRGMWWHLAAEASQAMAITIAYQLEYRGGYPTVIRTAKGPPT